jgi:hypothetical protein
MQVGQDGVPSVELTDQRSTPRFMLLIRAAKLTAPDVEFLCVVRDASESGVSVRLFHPLPEAIELTLELPNGDRHPLERVWEHEGKAGFRFREPVELERIVEARSEYPRRAVAAPARGSVLAGVRRTARARTIGNPLAARAR